MKKSLIGVVAVGAMLLFSAGTAAGDEHEGIPLHPHALVIGAGGDEITGFTAVGCVDLAANQAVPLHAHHDHIHAGMAGAALNEHTNNFAIPLAPYPFAFAEDCDSLFEAFEVTIVRGRSGNR